MMANKLYYLGKQRLHQILEFEIFVHFWISSLIGQFKNSEKLLCSIFGLTNQRRGRENSNFINGPNSDQIIVYSRWYNLLKMLDFMSVWYSDYSVCKLGKSEVVWHPLTGTTPKPQTSIYYIPKYMGAIT